MISTYLGSMTIVLKFPLTSAASTNGLQRYKGFWVPATGTDGDAGGTWSTRVEVVDIVEVGVGERLGPPLGPERFIVRLSPPTKKERKYVSATENPGFFLLRDERAYPMELKNDINGALTGRRMNDIGLWGSSTELWGLSAAGLGRCWSGLRGDCGITCSLWWGPIWLAALMARRSQSEKAMYVMSE